MSMKLEKKHKKNNEYGNIEEYIKGFFSKIPKDLDLLDKYIYNTRDEKVTIDYNLSQYIQTQENEFLLIKKRDRFDTKSGVLTIKGKKFEMHNFNNEFFDYASWRNFLYQKEDTFYPVKFCFKENELKNFNINNLSEHRYSFFNNLITGNIGGLNEHEKKHKEFLENNVSGENIGFQDCVFFNRSIENKTIITLTNTTATERLIFKNCTILETDFNFKNCPLVQFLGENSIKKIKNIYNITTKKLIDDIGDIYFSSGTNIGGEHTPEEKQYFFKQIKRFQEEKRDSLQTLVAHQKYLQEELKLKNIPIQDKFIIWGSQLFGSGINYMIPLGVLLVIFSFISFYLVCLEHEPFDVSLLFPTFPHIFFESVNDSHHLIQGVFFIYYIMMTVCWYFIIKSLHKFTYRK